MNIQSLFKSPVATLNNLKLGSTSPSAIVAASAGTPMGWIVVPSHRSYRFTLSLGDSLRHGISCCLALHPKCRRTFGESAGVALSSVFLCGCLIGGFRLTEFFVF